MAKRKKEAKGCMVPRGLEFCVEGVGRSGGEKTGQLLRRGERILVDGEDGQCEV
jgi:hypothetical protein